MESVRNESPSHLPIPILLSISQNKEETFRCDKLDNVRKLNYLADIYSSYYLMQVQIQISRVILECTPCI